MSADDVERLRQAFEAFARGDLDAALERVAPDFVINDRVIVEDTTDLRGPDGLRETQRRLLEGFAQTEFEPLELIDLEGRILARVRFRGTGATTEIPFEIEVGQLWELRDGLAVRCDVYPSWAEARQAAGL